MITNTSNDYGTNLIVMLGASIESIEQRGASELANSKQLPISTGGNRSEFNARKHYENMGIKVIGESKNDPLFADVILPEGWKIEYTNSNYWTELLDNKGRKRASIFYKAAFYDRDAFISFNKRFSISVEKYLPREQCGHYEKQMVTVRNPEYEDFKQGMQKGNYHGMDGFFYQKNDMRVLFYMQEPPKTIKVQQDVWIPKFKDNYEEYNNTPIYVEIKDGQDVIYSTKDNPVFFTKKYTKRWHSQWWRQYEAVEQNLRRDAEKWLSERYPDWGETSAYWD